MKAKRENKVYSITTEQEKQRYLKEGYDIYTDDGELLEYSPLKKISYSQYEALRKENVSLKGERLALLAEYDALRKENNTLREEVTVLKEENGILHGKLEPADTGAGDTVQEGKAPKSPGKKAGG